MSAAVFVIGTVLIGAAFVIGFIFGLVVGLGNTARGRGTTGGA
jgi:hypothetical protein